MRGKYNGRAWIVWEEDDSQDMSPTTNREAINYR